MIAMHKGEQVLWWSQSLLGTITHLWLKQILAAGFLFSMSIHCKNEKSLTYFQLNTNKQAVRCL